MKLLKLPVIILATIICLISCVSNGAKTNSEIKPSEQEDIYISPRVIKSYPPRYPISAKIKNIEGKVIIKFVVTKEGTVRDIEVIESFPIGVFDEAAIKCIEKFRFEPATKNGKPFDVTAKMPIEFTLDDIVTTYDFKVAFDEGYERLENNEFKEAIESLSSAIGIYKKYSPAYYFRGLAYNENGQRLKSLSDLDEAIKLDPEEPEYYQARGSVYLSLDDIAKAIADFTEVLKLDEGNIQAYTSRGYCRKKMNDTDNMCSDYKKACELGECRGYELLKNSGLCNDSDENSSESGLHF